MADLSFRAEKRKLRRQQRLAAQEAVAGEVRAVASGADNSYAASRDTGHKVDRRLQVLFVLVVILLAVYFIGLILPKNLFDAALHTSAGNDGYSLAWFMSDLMSNVNAVVVTFLGQTPDTGTYLPTMIGFILVALSGASMALSGAVFQGTFKNALVTPSTLGVMSGASIGMAVWVVFFYKEGIGDVLFNAGNTQSVEQVDYLASSAGLTLCSFVGCVAVVGLVLLAVRLGSRGSVSGIVMIITGQVIGAVMGAITNTMRYYYVETDPDGSKAQMLMQLQISSFFRGYGPIDIAMVGIPLLVAFCIAMRYRDQLTLLAFSEAEARSMGVETRCLRYGIVALFTLLTAIVVSFCGHVGFVGFLVPHMARRLVGPHYRYLLPVSLVLGAVFVLASYVIVLTLLGSSYATMTGMFISILGAGVFLFSLFRGEGARNGRF